MTKPPPPVRLRLARTPGFDLHRLSNHTNGLLAISVARPGRFGNPFRASEHGPEHAVALYRAWLDGIRLPDCDAPLYPSVMQGFDRAWVLARLPSLRGLNLACFCPLPAPGQPDCCHAATMLARVAASPPSPTETSTETGDKFRGARTATGPVPRRPGRA